MSKTRYSLQHLCEYKLLGLAHDNWEPFTDDTRITVCSRISRISFLQQLIKTEFPERTIKREIGPTKMNANLVQDTRNSCFGD